MILNIDTSNNTYSVEILDNNQDIDSVTPEKIKSIPSNNDNKYVLQEISERNIARELVTLYKNTILGYTKYFYENHLEEAYRKSNFASIDSFNKYIEKNRKKINKLNIEKYKIMKGKDTLIYSLIDSDGEEIFIEYYSVLDYKVYYNSYTTNIEPLERNYEKSNDNEKVKTQITKIKQMFNNKDYAAVYSKLNKEFKENNYPTVSSLEEYLKANIYENNEIEALNISEQEGYFICKCVLSNKQKEGEEKVFNIIIRLIDYSNFEISFSFK